MIIRVDGDGGLTWRDTRVRCALGRSGLSRSKREGDGATPEGSFLLRRVFYRADRLDAPPRTGLPLRAIGRYDGWCDDPLDTRYNRLVRLPCSARHESLWRQDGLYDLVAVIGHNDDPIIAGRGSAIFLHVATADFTPTEGCVAVAPDVLLAVLADCTLSSRILIGRRFRVL